MSLTALTYSISISMYGTIYKVIKDAHTKCNFFEKWSFEQNIEHRDIKIL